VSVTCGRSVVFSEYSGFVRVMVFNATFNNISVISWLLVFFIGGGNPSTQRKPSICRKSLTHFYHIMLYQVHLAWAEFELTTLVVIGTDCIGSYKSNYHTITILRAPVKLRYNITEILLKVALNTITLTHPEVWHWKSNTGLTFLSTAHDVGLVFGFGTLNVVGLIFGIFKELITLNKYQSQIQVQHHE
jgi:hypothetical protein